MNGLLLSLWTLAAAPASAQSQPTIELIPVSSEKRPRLAMQKVAVGDCYDVPGSQREELVLIQITIRGAWERTAEHLAKEKAAEIGANCLYPIYATGEDATSYPVRRNYRALRVTVPSGSSRAPASPEIIPSVGSYSAAALPSLSEFPKLRVPQIRASESHKGHLGWALGDGVVGHDVVIDFSKADAVVRKDILKDAEEYFPVEEYRRLLRAAENGDRTRIGLPH